jgi:hypothetical protein
VTFESVNKLGVEQVKKSARLFVLMSASQMSFPQPGFVRSRAAESQADINLAADGEYSARFVHTETICSQRVVAARARVVRIF